MQTDNRKTDQLRLLAIGGKLPPQAVDFEEAILGAIMLNSDAYLEASYVITWEVFYKDAHQKIFKACTNLFNRKHPIDILTVTQELRSMGELEMVGGAYAITELTSRVVSGSNVEYHCQIVMQKFLAREAIRISTETISESYDDTHDVFELLEKNQKSIYSLLGSSQKSEVDSIDELMAEFLEDLAIPPVDGLTGVGSGFVNVDTVTGGWQQTDLVIMAARPGMGKTAFALKNARNAAINFNKPVLIFSLEMSKRQLIARMAADECNIPFEKIRKKLVTPEEIEKMRVESAKLKRAPIFIDDTPGMSIFELRVKARRMKERFGIEMIIIDYLQLMTADKGKNGNREQEIGIISRSLKGLAKELNIPVIALSQLSRDVEKRAGAQKRPMLSDLRESGSIEQDADVVGFLYRPEYYGITQNAEGESTIGLCELIFAKNRSGTTETIKLDFNGAYMRFKDWDNPLTSLFQQAQQQNISFTAEKEQYDSRTDTDEDLPF